MFLTGLLGIIVNKERNNITHFSYLQTPQTAVF